MDSVNRQSPSEGGIVYQSGSNALYLVQDAVMEIVNNFRRGYICLDNGSPAMSAEGDHNE